METTSRHHGWAIPEHRSGPDQNIEHILDTVIDRVIELQVDEQLPIHVVPIRTPERVVAVIN